MKKQYMTIIIICLAAILSMQFLSCSNFLSLSLGKPAPALPDSSGKGSVTVSFSSNAARTALSPQSLNFNTYDFTFHNGAGSTTITRSSGSSFIFEDLELGAEYILEVKAYMGSGPGRILAAQGISESFPVEEDTYVYLELQGVTTSTGEGTFTWNISSEPGTFIDKLLLYMNDSKYYDLKNEDDFNTTSGTQQVTAGRYLLIVRLSRLDGTIAGYANGVEIYPGQITSYEPEMFILSDFKDPNIEGVGISIDRWHGFNISGVHDYETPGNPKGTLYYAYRDYTGRLTDVLKLEPPAGSTGAYEKGSYAMTYKAPIAGYYRLSMKVKIESTPGKVIRFGFEHINNDGGWEVIAGDLENPTSFPANTWVTITYNPAEYPEGILLEENDTFALNTKQDGDHNPETNNLDNCTIYIRDLLLEVDTDHGTVTLIGGTDTGLKITPQSLILYSKDSVQLQLSGDISGGKPVWSSSDTAESSITLDQSGRINVKMIKEEKTITVKVKSGVLEAQTQIKVNPKLIALTFDDGPEPAVTTTVLQHLKNAKDTEGNSDPVHATFFLIGKSAENNPSWVNTIVADGHEIGSHSYSHNPDIYYDWDGVKTAEDYRDELIKAQNIIFGITGKAPVFFRPPYVTTRPNLRIVTEEMGLPRISGELLYDWDRSNKWETIRDNALARSKPWGILILHDYENGSPPYKNEDGSGDDWVGNGLEMVKAIPSIIEKLREDGYEFVTVGEMMNRKKILYLEPSEGYSCFEKVPSDAGFPANITEVESLKVTPATTFSTPVILDAAMGQTIQMTAAVSHYNATRSKVHWYSENDRIATVDSTGTIIPLSAGNTIIYACADGSMDKVYVQVTGALGPSSWGNFNFAGNGTNHTASNAVGTVVDFDGFTNVLRLSPADSGGYFGGKPPNATIVAMAFTVPEDGTYELSMFAYVVRHPNYPDEEDEVRLSWEVDEMPLQIAGNWDTNLSSNTWYLVDSNHRPDYGDGIYCAPVILEKGDKIFLMLRDDGDDMLHDATIYFRDMKVLRNGVPIITIPSGHP